VWIEPIHYAEASQLAERLQEIFPVGDGQATAPATPARPQRARPPRPATSASSPSPNPTAQGGASTIGTSGASRITKILADERTNSLIIMATERAYLRILQMIRQLDVPLDGEGGIHVHYLQHGDAEEISTTLQSLIGGGSSASSRSTSGAARTKARPAQQRATPSAAGSIGNFQGDIRITAHKPSNALVVTASLHDYQTLRHVIERLDAPRRQVFIEAVIMELSTSSTRELGLSFHGGLPDTAGDGSVSVFGLEANRTSSLAGGLSNLLTGTAFGLFGPQLESSTSLVGTSIPTFGIALNALSGSGDVDILSTPHLMAMDNTLAEISVGANIPLQTSGVGGLASAAGGLGGLAGLAGGAQGAAGLAGLAGLGGGLGGSLPRQDVGTTLRITPHINDDGQIRMEIEQEITSEGDRDGPNGAISINRRTAKTQVVVRDQETVVIGGQVRERTIASRRGIPVLSDIPLIGALFRRTSTQQVRSNLLLFLTPYVIRDQTDLRRIFERKMQERQEFLDRYFVFGENEYEPHVDYDRTSGLVMEIIQQVEEIEREEELNAAAAATPPPGHEPRPPVDGAFELQDGDSLIEPDDSESPEAASGDAASPAAPDAQPTAEQSVEESTPTAEAASTDTQSPRES
jgi:general secretion pathway protein D